VPGRPRPDAATAPRAESATVRADESRQRAAGLYACLCSRRCYVFPSSGHLLIG
jgi:hypothetical protein